MDTFGDYFKSLLSSSLPQLLVVHNIFCYLEASVIIILVSSGPTSSTSSSTVQGVTPSLTHFSFPYPDPNLGTPSLTRLVVCVQYCGHYTTVFRVLTSTLCCFLVFFLVCVPCR